MRGRKKNMQGEMKKFWIITKEIYKKNVKTVGFLLLLFMPVVLVVVPFIFGYLAGGGTEEEIAIAVLTEDNTMYQAVSSEDLPWTVDESLTTESAIEEAILNEEIEAYIELHPGERVEAQITQIDNSMGDYLPVLEEVLFEYQMYQQADEMNLSEEELASLTGGALIQSESIRVEEGVIIEGNAIESVVQPLFVAFMIFAVSMLLGMYSAGIIQEIASEKGTRIMEIILSTTSATTHFFGKFVGFVLVLLTQFAVYALVLIIAAPYLDDVQMIQSLFDGVNILDIIQPTFWYLGLFFILGLLTYIIFGAFLGSLTNKVEDAARMGSPIQMCTFVGMYGGLYMISGAESMFTTVLSYIPLFSPFIMPMRIVHEQVGVLGIVLSLIASAVFMLLLLAFSLYFYRSNVLVYSDTNIWKTLKQSWSILQSNRLSKKAQIQGVEN
jgi:ABC-2 type transport system permease protein